MDLLAIKVIGILFVLLMSYLTFLHLRRKEFTIKETVFWFGAWAIFLFITLFPTSLDFFIKDVLGFSRRLDFFIIIGFMFSLGILFYTYMVMRKTQKNVEKLVRAISFNQNNKK
jgi:hypothetical protein